MVLPDQMKITSLVELIDKAEAQQMLKGRTGLQRKIQDGLVDKYSDLLAHGQWALNGDSITISASGVILNGNHRLETIVSTGKSMVCIVTRGIPDKQPNGTDTFLTIDSENRNNVDVLEIAGYTTKTKEIVQLLRGMGWFNDKNIVYHSAGKRYNNIEIVQLAKSYNKQYLLDIVHASEDSMAKAKFDIQVPGTTQTKEVNLLSLGFWLILHYIAPNIPKGEEFVTELANPQTTNLTIQSLQQQLAIRFAHNGDRIQISGAAGKRKRWTLIFKAYGYFKNGVDVVDIPYSEIQDTPQNFVHIKEYPHYEN